MNQHPMAEGSPVSNVTGSSASGGNGTHQYRVEEDDTLDSATPPILGALAAQQFPDAVGHPCHDDLRRDLSGNLRGNLAGFGGELR